MIYPYTNINKNVHFFYWTCIFTVLLFLFLVISFHQISTFLYSSKIMNRSPKNFSYSIFGKKLFCSKAIFVNINLYFFRVKRSKGSYSWVQFEERYDDRCWCKYNNIMKSYTRYFLFIICFLFTNLKLNIFQFFFCLFSRSVLVKKVI